MLSFVRKNLFLFNHDSNDYAGKERFAGAEQKETRETLQNGNIHQTDTNTQ
jgi:hypothetical protein